MKNSIKIGKANFFEEKTIEILSCVDGDFKSVARNSR